MFTEDQNVKYTEETYTVMIREKLITVTNRTPILSPEERAKRKKEIEHKLYNIFIKYVDKESSEDI